MPCALMIGANDFYPASFLTRGKDLVDLVGFEPTTSSMPWKRAPNCATGPLRKKHDPAQKSGSGDSILAYWSRLVKRRAPTIEISVHHPLAGFTKTTKMGMLSDDLMKLRSACGWWCWATAFLAATAMGQAAPSAPAPSTTP